MHLIVFAGCAVYFGCAAWVGFAAVRHLGVESLLLPMICLCLAVGATAIATIFACVFPGRADFLHAVAWLADGALVLTIGLAAFGVGALAASLMNSGDGNNKQ
jgi:hypothetical protein